MDLVFRQFFLRCSFQTFYDKYKIKIVLSACEYYIRDNGDEYRFYEPIIENISINCISWKQRSSYFNIFS